MQNEAPFDGRLAPLYPVLRGASLTGGPQADQSSMALTMSSTIFFASASSIMVWSM